MRTYRTSRLKLTKKSNNGCTARKPTLFCFVPACKLILANFPNIFQPNLEPITKTYIPTLSCKPQTFVFLDMSVSMFNIPGKAWKNVCGSPFQSEDQDWSCNNSLVLACSAWSRLVDNLMPHVMLVIICWTFKTSAPKYRAFSREQKVQDFLSKYLRKANPLVQHQIGNPTQLFSYREIIHGVPN